MSHYLSIDTIKTAYNQLIDLEIDNASILHIFLILKGCGYNRISFEPSENISNLGYEKALRISYLFSPNEIASERYDFINPFDMKQWHSQSPSESLRKWVGGRIKNNVLGGATTWRSFIIDDPQQRQFKFAYNYVDEIKKLTLIDQKANLVALSIWANRFVSFSKPISLSVLISEFVSSYNIESEELSELFHTSTSSIKIEFSDKMHNAEEIRRLIGNPQDDPKWIEAGTRSHEGENFSFSINEFNMSDTNQSTVTEQLVLEGLNDYHQVILSGPPGTSKSFLADSVAKNFDEVKRIQFHPQYSYQDFIGGYIVNKTEVEYRKGVLLDILNYLKDNADKKYLLIIDEINRGNVSQIFGEAIQCLDRNYTTQIKIDGKDSDINLPTNLYILGTMNSSDRTLGVIDHAVRRRFLNIYVPPNPQVILELVTADDDISLYDFIRKINLNLVSVLKNRELVLGHSVFLSDNVKTGDKYHWSLDKLETVFNYKILPTVEDYCYGDDTKIKDVLGDKLPQRLHGDDFKAALLEFCSI